MTYLSSIELCNYDGIYEIMHMRLHKHIAPVLSVSVSDFEEIDAMSPTAKCS